MTRPYCKHIFKDGTCKRCGITWEDANAIAVAHFHGLPEPENELASTDEDFDLEEAAAKAVARDYRMIAAQIDGGDVTVMLRAEPDASLENEQRLRALFDLALARLRQEVAAVRER